MLASGCQAVTTANPQKMSRTWRVEKSENRRASDSVSITRKMLRRRRDPRRFSTFRHARRCRKCRHSWNISQRDVAWRISRKRGWEKRVKNFPSLKMLSIIISPHRLPFLCCCCGFAFDFHDVSLFSFIPARKMCGSCASKWKSRIQMSYQNVMRYLCQTSDEQCHYGDRKRDAARIN